jgi:photosystem II stability/assembly factor-like uncharacterized protein
MRSFALLFCFVLSFSVVRAQNYRGLHAVNDSVVWVSGNKGTVLRTINGGKHWDTLNPLGFVQKDFRDIHAWDALTAVVLSSGAEAIILKTKNGGKTWDIVFENDREDVFLNAMDFDGSLGVAIGDPLWMKQFSTRMFDLIYTCDYGDSWTCKMPTDLSYVPAVNGEGLFAASGSNIRIYALPQTFNKAKIFFVTGGGSQSRLVTNQNFTSLPFRLVSAGGAYSLAETRDRKKMVIVGGSYLQPNYPDSNAVYLNTTLRQFLPSETQPKGYRSCACTFGKGDVFVTTGISGSDYSFDAGRNWKPLPIDGFNVCTLSDKFVWFAGDSGKILKYDLTKIFDLKNIIPLQKDAESESK